MIQSESYQMVTSEDFIVIKSIYRGSQKKCAVGVLVTEEVTFDSVNRIFPINVVITII